MPGARPGMTKASPAYGLLTACFFFYTVRPTAETKMLFNSYPFIFLFLPIALAGYFVLGRFGNLAPVIWLALASLAFYSVSNWQFVLLLLGSIAFNYLIGLLLISGRLQSRLRFAVLSIGVTGDLLVLG